MDIQVFTDHAQCLDILKAAGTAPPEFLPDADTALVPFTTATGFPAIAVNQRRMRRRPTDADHNLNGLTVAICATEPPPANAHGQLMKWAHDLIFPR